MARAHGTDDDYSWGMSPARMWWGMIPVAVIITGSVIVALVGAKPFWYLFLGIALLLVFGLLGGYGDGSWGYPVARGAVIPFVIVGIVTAGSLSALYLAAYWAGKRIPLRREESMQYERRHQRN